MIYCPDCGTANRDGSRFCNECGQSLAARTGFKCPQCGTLNAVQSVFCSTCGGRLLDRPAPTSGPAAAPIKGLSLPTKPAFGEEASEPEPAAEPVAAEEEVPAWLRELGATLAADTEPAARPPAPDQEEMPSWLRDLRASLPEEAEAEAAPPSETLATGQAGLPRPETVGAALEEELPDWLAALRADQGESLPPRPPAPGPEARATDRPAEHEPAEELPAWLAQLRQAPDPEPSPPTQQPAASEATPEEMPDWLAELRPVPASSPEAPPAEAVPDWLFELRSTPVEPPAAAAPRAAAGDEVPDWLADLQAGAPAASAPAQPEPAEELPDWLAAMRSEPGHAGTAPAAGAKAELPDWPAGQEAGAGAPATPAAPAATEPEPAEELPDWLIALRPESGEAAAPQAAAETELPDWLAGLRAGATAPPPAPAPEPEPADELPDWLSTLRSEPGEATAPQAAEAELPDWLSTLRSEPGEAAAETAAPAEPDSADWLANLRRPVAATPPPAGQERDSRRPTGSQPADDEEADEELPGWLAELQPPTTGQPGTPAGPPAAGRSVPGWLSDLDATSLEEEPLAAGELPDWLVPSGELGDEDTMARAEIPAWLLALKPRELKEEGEPEPEEMIFEEPVEQTGLLAGIRDVLPVEMIIAQPRAAAASTPEAAVVETPEARLFAEVVALPLMATAKTMPRSAPRLLSRLPWWLVFALLLAAVAVPLLLTESPLERTIEPIPAVAAAYQAVESLPGGAPVLMVFDYDPATSGEMDLVAEPLVRHLMDRRARIIAVSLLPTGPATADSLLARMAADRPDYQPGGPLYANLGFLPGQATAVRLMGQDLLHALPRDFSGTLLADVEPVAGITGTQSFALVVELAAGADTLRWWIEQAAVPYGLPLVAGVSAIVDPVARPYFESESPQIRGVVAGVLGAAGYEVARSGPDALPRPLTARLDALLAGQVVMIAVLLVGNAIYLVRRGTGRK